MKKYEQHPLGKPWSRWDEEAFKLLIDDIDKNGVREKIVVYQGKILDGWHRYQACLELGVKNIPMREFEGNNPTVYVVSANYHRRHDSVSIRAMSLAQTIETAKEMGLPYQDVEQIGEGKFTPPTIKQTAITAGVSEKTMKFAKAATKAIPEVQQAVIDGEMAVSQAAKLSKLPPEEQKAAVSAPKERKPKTQKAPKPPKLESEETVPLAEYRILQDKYDELSSNYQVLAAELDACEAIRNGEQMDHFKKLNQQLIAVTASRDEFQNKCGELTRQVNYLNAKLKKTKE